MRSTISGRAWGWRRGGARKRISGGGLQNKQFNDFVPAGDPLAQFFVPPSTTWTPRVLKDGSDSVGALGALNRVYINIGLFSEEWLLHFRPVLGGEQITPIPIETAQKNSAYWLATELQTLNMARFFLASTDPHYLKDAPGGPAYLQGPRRHRRRGKVVFAERCARCHSSKLPTCRRASISRSQRPELPRGVEPVLGLDQDRGVQDARCGRSCCADNFLQGQLSSRPSCASRPRSSASMPAARSRPTPFATTSGTTSRPSRTSRCRRPGRSRFAIPSPAARLDYPLPAGGRGYIRPASLVSLWSTAPFLQNNTVGPFEYEPIGRVEDAVVPGVDRADAVARTAATRISSLRTRTGRASVSSTGSPSTAISRSPKATFRRPSPAHRHRAPALPVPRRRAAGRSGSVRSRRACRSASSPTWI